MPETLHDWTLLRLLDYQSVGEYNHEVHKISSKLRFCGKEPTDAEKIDKTLWRLDYREELPPLLAAAVVAVLTAL